jgi:hypothetical protein
MIKKGRGGPVPVEHLNLKRMHYLYMYGLVLIIDGSTAFMCRKLQDNLLDALGQKSRFEMKYRNCVTK